MNMVKPAFSLTRDLPTLEATEELGREIALVARPGAIIALGGELGAGKTFFARALIRALAGNRALDVPSPTFTLIQIYEETRIPVAHADLYRMRAGDDLAELGLEELSDSHLLIVEWADRLGNELSANRLDVELTLADNGRSASLTGRGSWVRALSRLQAIRGFLEAGAWAEARRTFLEGDASFRRYERLFRKGESAVLMDMPARPDGPPVKKGKAYSAIAHLAEDIRAVVAVNGLLLARGFSAPEIYDVDLDRGLALIEDLGDMVFGKMLLAGRDISEELREAVRLIAHIAGRDWPQSAPVGGADHPIPPYDIDALEIEIDLLLEWLWPVTKKRSASREERESFFAAWRGPLLDAVPERPVWTLRDYHSPNLIWLPGREGLRRVGLIDTQDCVMGHPAYDLVSMLQDARVDIPRSTAAELLDFYCDIRRGSSGFDEGELRRAVALYGAQRATKILGIFARLSRRDGKHQYLRHIPRVSRYLERNLEQPHLASIKTWFDRHLPVAEREGPIT
jgi:tRNA threonylcarbamoyl adenosine modification protein YjeE